MAARFAAKGSVSIEGFLDPDAAAALAHELGEAEEWLEIFRAGEKVYEMPHAQFAALSAGQRAELDRMIIDAARTGLQYRYRAIRVSENPAARAARGTLLDSFADLLNAPETLALLRSVTGCTDVGFVDAQATDYRAGDFLTDHDDAIEGKHRTAAYVFGLTRHWRADWGGLLLFDDAREVSGYIPDFNVLRLFAVPRSHHVSCVAPWVEARRLSVTGWLRRGAPDQTGS